MNHTTKRKRGVATATPLTHQSGPPSGSGALRDRIDRDLPPVLVLELELDDTVHQGEQGVIVAPAHVLARVELGAPLADDDVARNHLLATEPLDAEILRVAGPPVPAGAYALLVCHGCLSR